MSNAVDIPGNGYTEGITLQSEAVQLQLNYNKTIKLTTIPKSFGFAMSYFPWAERSWAVNTFNFGLTQETLVWFLILPKLLNSTEVLLQYTKVDPNVDVGFGYKWDLAKKWKGVWITLKNEQGRNRAFMLFSNTVDGIFVSRTLPCAGKPQLCNFLAKVVATSLL